VQERFAEVLGGGAVAVPEAPARLRPLYHNSWHLLQVFHINFPRFLT